MNHPGRQISRFARSLTLTAALTAAAPIGAQAVLPATAPTAVTPSQLPSANPALPHGQASVHWDGHLLQIAANGESLAEVLSEVALRAGIHMSGTTPEDRIYGTYGPAPLVDVLSDLVSGLSVNMLFVDRAGTRPAELTFTARNGAATPPSAASSQPQFPQQFSQQQQRPPEQPGPPPQTPGAGAPGAGALSGSDTANNGQGTPATAAQPGDSGNPASPNGVKTPQQIFEQLQRLRANAGSQQ